MDDKLSTLHRRERIRDHVVETGAARIDDLAAEYGVTAMTIHRDLNVLETQGWVRKVRGGAEVDNSALIDTSVRHRLTDRNNSLLVMTAPRRTVADRRLSPAR